jgi:hypothetical protein
MAVVITLVLGTLGARLVGWLVSTTSTAGRRRRNQAGRDVRDDRGRALRPADAARHDPIVPPRLPAPGLLVTVGRFELVGAAGLLYPPAASPRRSACSS